MNKKDNVCVQRHYISTRGTDKETKEETKYFQLLLKCSKKSKNIVMIENNEGRTAI